MLVLDRIRGRLRSLGGLSAAKWALAIACCSAGLGCAKLGGLRGGQSSGPPLAQLPPLPREDALPGPPAEWIRDGGDRGAPAAGYGDGLLAGVDPSDTVAEYDQVGGRHRVTRSNTVSVYSPRFGRVRSVVGLAGLETTEGPEHLKHAVLQSQLMAHQDSALAQQSDRSRGLTHRKQAGTLAGRRASGVVAQLEHLDGYVTELGPLEVANRLADATLTTDERAELERGVAAARVWSQPESARIVAFTQFGVEVSARVAPEGAVQYESRRRPGALALVKLASKESASSGEIVEFVLRYDNRGGRPLEKIVITDSLAARLEYVSESAQSSRPARFAAEPNEAGSEMLRWEIDGELEGHDHGIIRFQARVR